MDRFSLFLESKVISLNMVTPFVSNIINNIEDEQTMLVFADWLQETDDPDLAYAAEGIRKMLSDNPYSDDKKNHNELLNYHNRLMGQIYRAFERLDAAEEPHIDALHGYISWLSDERDRKTINASNPAKITMSVTNDDNYTQQNFKSFLSTHQEFDSIMARFLVLMIISREENSWVRRRSNTEQNSRMSGIYLNRLHTDIYRLLDRWTNLDAATLRDVARLFAQCQKAGAGAEALASAGNFLIRIVHQLDFQDRAGPLANEFYDLGERYGGWHE